VWSARKRLVGRASETESSVRSSTWREVGRRCGFMIKLLQVNLSCPDAYRSHAHAAPEKSCHSLRRQSRRAPCAKGFKFRCWFLRLVPAAAGSGCSANEQASPTRSPTLGGFETNASNPQAKACIRADEPCSPLWLRTTDRTNRPCSIGLRDRTTIACTYSASPQYRRQLAYRRTLLHAGEVAGPLVKCRVNYALLSKARVGRAALKGPSCR